MALVTFPAGQVSDLPQALTTGVEWWLMKTPSTKRVKVIPIKAKLRDMVIKVVLMDKAKMMRVKNMNNWDVTFKING